MGWLAWCIDVFAEVMAEVFSAKGIICQRSWPNGVSCIMTSVRLHHCENGFTEELAQLMLSNLIKCQPRSISESINSNWSAQCTYVDTGVISLQAYQIFAFRVYLDYILPSSSTLIAGKTTLTESLKDTLGASLLSSPPRCLSPFRSLFDREPPLIRRAFYALGNYITMEKVHQEAMKAPVIIDR